VPELDSCRALRDHVQGFTLQEYSIAQALRLTAKKYADRPTLSALATYDWLYGGDIPE
jgi:hypothetical protein